MHENMLRLRVSDYYKACNVRPYKVINTEINNRAVNMKIPLLLIVILSGAIACAEHSESVHGKSPEPQQKQTGELPVAQDDRFIVVLKENADKTQVINRVKQIEGVTFGEIIFDIDNLVMFTVQVAAQPAIAKILAVDGVDDVEKDAEVKAL